MKVRVMVMGMMREVSRVCRIVRMTLADAQLRLEAEDGPGEKRPVRGKKRESRKFEIVEAYRT